MSERIRHDRRRITLGLGTALGVSLVSAVRVSAEPLLITPAQVEGPFYPVVDQADRDLDLTRVDGHTSMATGEVVLVRGVVRDTQGAALPNALVDVWQANHHGRYAHPEDPNPGPLDPDFQGWGMVRTDAAGKYEFKTIKPGPYSLEYLGGQGWRCRHIHFKVLGEGCLPLTTQMYFAGDPLIEQDDEIAKAPADRRQSLIAEATVDPASGRPVYHFDVVLARG